MCCLVMRQFSSVVIPSGLRYSTLASSKKWDLLTPHIELVEIIVIMKRLHLFSKSLTNAKQSAWGWFSDMADNMHSRLL